MKRILFSINMLLFFGINSLSQDLDIITWNIRDFGDRLTEEQVNLIATVIENSDIVTIQEVVTNPSGNEKAGAILEQLRKSNLSWNYLISDPSDSSPYFSERYLIFWNGDYVTKVGEPWMEFHFKNEVEREPFMCNFDFQGTLFTLGTIHAKSKVHQPETDLKFLKLLPPKYPYPIVLTGDFNVNPNHTVFNPLINSGYIVGNKSIKTTLKQDFHPGDFYGKNAYDNFLVPSIFMISSVSEILVIEDRNDLHYWREISDHVPLIISLIAVPQEGSN
jgi:deoxyribonuclease-1-like protein